MIANPPTPPHHMSTLSYASEFCRVFIIIIIISSSSSSSSISISIIIISISIIIISIIIIIIIIIIITIIIIIKVIVIIKSSNVSTVQLLLSLLVDTMLTCHLIRYAHVSMCTRARRPADIIRFHI